MAGHRRLDNRFDGNLFLNARNVSLNVEGGPGANLIANNIIVAASDNSSGLIGTWASNRNWAVNNTLVGGASLRRGGLSE